MRSDASTGAAQEGSRRGLNAAGSPKAAGRARRFPRPDANIPAL